MRSPSTLRAHVAVPPLTLLRAILWTFIVLLVTRTIADADLWGHLRFGLDILQTGSLHSTDAYSFTSDRPWINHEWLAELSMAIAYEALGPTGLILLKLSVIALVARLLWTIAGDERARPLGRDLFVALVVFVTYTRTQVVRPQLFSVALFATLLYLLREADRGRPKALWAIPVCFAVWVNCHGGWLVGLSALGMWMAADAWRQPRRTLVLAPIGVLTIAATLVNPYGIGMWEFLAETVRAHRPDISDWKPLLELPTGIIVIQAILPALALVALWKEGRTAVRPKHAAVLILLLVATFRVGRVDAFLQLAIAFFLAAPIVALLNRVVSGLDELFSERSLKYGVMALVIVAYAATAVAQNLRGIQVYGRWIPDRDAAMFLRDTRPGARVLTWFDWGEYALWQLSPADISVSMDGRRETVYSQQVIDDHNRFYEGHPDMIDYPDRIGADHVWLPSHFKMVDRLTSRGWTKVLDTGKSVVLTRAGSADSRYKVQRHDGPPVFPWP